MKIEKHRDRAKLFFHLICRYEDKFLKVDREDALSECLLASLEYPEDFRKAIRLARRKLNPLLSWKLRRLPCYEMSRNTDHGPEPMLQKWAEKMIQDYEENNFPYVREKYRIPDTRKIRKALSEIAPKPDKASRPHGKTVKVDCRGKSRDELVAEGLNRVTAWRAAKRGYYYKPI